MEETASPPSPFPSIVHVGGNRFEPQACQACLCTSQHTDLHAALEGASVAQRAQPHAPRFSRHVKYQCTTPFLQAGMRWPKGVACNNGPLHSKDLITSELMAAGKGWPDKRHHCLASRGQHSLLHVLWNTKEVKHSNTDILEMYNVPCCPQTHHTQLPLGQKIVISTQTQQLATPSWCSLPYDCFCATFIATITLCIKRTACPHRTHLAHCA